MPGFLNLPQLGNIGMSDTLEVNKMEIKSLQARRIGQDKIIRRDDEPNVKHES